MKIEKEIIGKDEYGVRRILFVAGQEVDDYSYYMTIKRYLVEDAENLPKSKYDTEIEKSQVEQVETKVLPVEEAEKPEAPEKSEAEKEDKPSVADKDDSKNLRRNKENYGKHITKRNS